MKRLLTIAGLLFVLSGSATRAQTPVDTAFIDVNVVPMDQNRVLQHQTVLVRGGLIAAVGPAPITDVPARIQLVEGHGTAFLLPGLADMHTHVMETEDLALYTANGVTTILHMGLAPANLVDSANRDIDSGDLVGPHVFFAFMIDGSPALHRFFVSTPAQGRHAVELAKANGYDFIKLYNNVTAPEFKAIVDEAHRQGLAVIGHGVRAVGLPQALFEGQVMVAHAEEFFYTAFHNQPDASLIAGVVDATLRSGAFVTPNLSTFEAISKQWGKREVVTGFLNDPRAHFMTPGMRLNWVDMDYVTRKGNIDPILAFLRTFTKALQNAGVPLITGTDSPVIPGMYPGYSIHDDLRTMIEAGLTPYEALSAATRTPGEFMAKYVPAVDHFGMVKVGMKADLVLVRSNPLDSVETLKSPLGVMSAGRWRSSANLTELLARQKAKYDALLK